MTNVVFVVLSFRLLPVSCRRRSSRLWFFESGVVELVVRIEVEVLGVVVQKIFCVVSVAAFVHVVVAVVVVVNLILLKPLVMSE